MFFERIHGLRLHKLMKDRSEYISIRTISFQMFQDKFVDWNNKFDKTFYSKNVKILNIAVLPSKSAIQA